MAETTGVNDLVYDLISVQYHALKAGDVYEKYMRDAEGNPEIQEFFREIQGQDASRATRAHELLKELTKQQGLT